MNVIRETFTRPVHHIIMQDWFTHDTVALHTLYKGCRVQYITDDNFSDYRLHMEGGRPITVGPNELLTVHRTRVIS